MYTFGRRERSDGMDTHPSRERVEEMEKRLNRLSPLVEQYARATEAFIQAREDMKALFAYYGSPEWYADLDAQARGEIPPEVPCGVLAEDLVYDLITRTHDTAIEMLEAATEALKII